MTKRKENPEPGGRPTKWREEFDDQAYKLCLLLGATDVDLAAFFEVEEKTINNWKKAHPSFLQALARGKTISDGNVAERLYRRATGYEHDAVKIFMPAGASKPVYAPYVEHYPPDTPAAALWLSNRQPDKWRNRSTTELTGADGKDLAFSDHEAAAKLAALLESVRARLGEGS